MPSLSPPAPRSLLAFGLTIAVVAAVAGALLALVIASLL
jgi:Na+-translocating ferredoxin:NAD+ oxidoreductase RnfG subunit